jgi:hypothetical protein
MALILFIALLCWASLASGAAPVQGSGCINHTANAVSVSYPCTINAGSNRAVVLGIVIGDSAQSVSSLSFAGAAVTSVTTETTIGRRLEMYRHMNPPTGSQNFAFDVSGFADVGGTTLQFTGVHQTTPHDTAATATGAPPSTGSTLNTGSASGDLVVDLIHECCSDCSTEGTNFNPGGGQTVAVREYNADLGGFLAMSTKAGAASVTMTWACTTPTIEIDWLTIGVSLNPVAVAAPSPFRRRVP